MSVGGYVAAGAVFVAVFVGLGVLLVVFLFGATRGRRVTADVGGIPVHIE